MNFCKLVIMNLMLLTSMFCFAGNNPEDIGWVKFQLANGYTGECLSTDLRICMQIEKAKRNGMSSSRIEEANRIQQQIAQTKKDETLVQTKADDLAQDRAKQVEIYSETFVKQAFYGDRSNVIFLLDKKSVDINYRDKQFGTTAIFQAIANNHIELAIELIKRGADTEIRDNTGNSVLDWCYDDFARKKISCAIDNRAIEIQKYTFNNISTPCFEPKLLGNCSEDDIDFSNIDFSQYTFSTTNR
ncbi:MAG: ankyrin repeat domain-containing protein [Candidatus Chromulinivorax sp.]|nr:ankyrin repeat domain-containing protein [Candidatus Chromulinivorax sp.]